MNNGNPQFERDFEAFLGDEDSRIAALYRKLPAAEPDASLDAAVLALAQRAVARPRTRARWLPVSAAAAVMLIAAGVVLRIAPQMQQRPAALPDAAPAAPATNTAPAVESAPSPTALPEPAMESPTPAPAPAPKAASHDWRKTENAAARSAPRAFPAPVAAMREPALPPAAGEAKPMPQAPTMASPMRAKQSADAESAGAPAQALAAPAARDRNATLYPEHWLANIRQMLRDGHREEALRSLAQFRGRYPDYPLPDDLRDLR